MSITTNSKCPACGAKMEPAERIPDHFFCWPCGDYWEKGTNGRFLAVKGDEPRWPSPREIVLQEAEAAGRDIHDLADSEIEHIILEHASTEDANRLRLQVREYFRTHPG